jgi:protein-tyrosine phosphatase
VLRHLGEAEGVDVEIASAGTGSWHVGSPPDERSTDAARARGITLSGAAQQVTAADFDAYDLLIAMDRENERDLLALAPDDEARAKVRLLRSFDPEAVAAGELDVPDPYYGGPDGFDHVLDVVERGARGLLATLR